jgi:hypothetical protein
MACEIGQASSSHARQPGKEIEKPSIVDGMKVGSPFSPSLLRPASASDFCDFLKQEYPGLMSSDIVDQLKFHNARCIMHSNIFKDAIIRENMKLAARILDKFSQVKDTKKTSLRGRREDYFSASESETESENKRARLKKNSKYIYIPTLFILTKPDNLSQLEPASALSILFLHCSPIR